MATRPTSDSASKTPPIAPSDQCSRRAFFKGSGAAAAATAVAARAKEAIADEGPAVVRGATTISLQVNGKAVSAEVEPRTTLLDVLRYQFGLTGAKPVSVDGSSGASTVLIDGRPAMASTTLAITAANKQVTTVESLGGDAPDECIRVFVEHDAEQCGFCTPGFVIAVRAFLNKHPDATEEQIRTGLNGNICRCGTYANVLQAATAIVKGA